MQIEKKKHCQKGPHMVWIPLNEISRRDLFRDRKIENEL